MSHISDLDDPAVRVSFAVRRKEPPPVSSHWQLLLAAVFLAALVVVGRVQARDTTIVLDMDGSRRTFQGSTVADMTIFDTMRAAAAEGGFTVRTASRRDEPVKVYLRPEGRASEYLAEALTLNGRRVDISAIDEEVVENGDQVVVFLSETAPVE